MLNEIKVTEDGSHTLFVPEIDECYHSTHGAIQESGHIFIGAGLNQCAKSEINVLEIGFGTGLNAFMTLLEGEKSGRKIHFTSLEKCPVEMAKVKLLNYSEVLAPDKNPLFEQLHLSPWNEEVQITPLFTLKKIEADFTEYDFTDNFDVVYYDAFSPEKQPEMWTDEIIQKIASKVKKDGILVTYCAKGSVRRAFSSAGFHMERIPGPIGKKEILKGKKTN